MGNGYDSEGYWTGQLDETNGVRFGMGKGTIIDVRGDEPPTLRIVDWASSALAGHRLLLKGSSHKEIKRAQKWVTLDAKRHGLTLAWRFCREITMEKRFIHPEWIDQPVTEYQAWAVVRAKDLTINLDKQAAYTDSVLRWLVWGDDHLTPANELPPWIMDLDTEEIEVPL
jgi:hypothetical protein